MGKNVPFTVEAEREAAEQKAAKEERRGIRQKKALQKANQQAGISDSDDEFEQRANPTVSLPYY